MPVGLLCEALVHVKGYYQGREEGDCFVSGNLNTVFFFILEKMVVLCLEKNCSEKNNFCSLDIYLYIYYVLLVASAAEPSILSFNVSVC